MSCLSEANVVSVAIEDFADVSQHLKIFELPEDFASINIMLCYKTQKEFNPALARRVFGQPNLF